MSRSASFVTGPWAAVLLLPFLAVGLATGCDDDLEEGPSGQSITGRIFYSGDAAAGLSRPAVQVFAFATFPPQGPPHASVTIPEPDLVNGTQYELQFVEAGTYYVNARLVDLDTNPDGDGLPGGAYPDYCALSNSAGNVTLTGDEGQVGINITLYGAGGAQDPCNEPSEDVCPEAGRASISLTIESSLAAADIGENDTLTYALFADWPTEVGPTRFQVVTSDDLVFPLTVVDNNAPAEQQAIYTCYDRGGDNQQCGGEGDIEAVHDEGALVDFAEATITTASLTLETGASEIVSVQDAEDAGCEVDPGPGDDVCPEAGRASMSLVIESSLTADDLGDNDTVTYALFEDWPATTGPTRFQVVTSDDLAFPLTIVDTNVPAEEQVIYACYDSGGDNQRCDGEGDIIAVHDEGALVDFAEATITTASLTLETSASEIVSVQDAEDAGCEVDPMGTVQVNVASTDLTPADGDALSVSLFEEFPPAGGPAFFTVVDELETFPLDVTVVDVDAGDWYLAVCHDAGGDSSSCTSEGDTLVWYLDGESPVTVRDQETLHIYQSMEGESLTPNTIQLVLHSESLTPEDGDVVSASAFEEFPPAGPPDAATTTPLVGFPAVVTLSDVDPGEYYVFGCYDSGGDNTSCDGEGDVLVPYAGGQVSIEMTEGSSFNLNLSLDPEL